MYQLKIKAAEIASGFLSKSDYAYKLSKLIVRKRDNDGNADMNTNGEKHLLDFLLKNNLLEVVFDIGANVGDYSNMISNYNKDIIIYAFEPGPGNINILTARLAECNNVKIIPNAVSNVLGEISYYQNLNPES